MSDRHPMALSAGPIPEHPMDAPGWRCRCCGESPDAGGRWRWAVDRWEHWHRSFGWVPAVLDCGAEAGVRPAPTPDP